MDYVTVTNESLTIKRLAGTVSVYLGDETVYPLDTFTLTEWAMVIREGCQHPNSDYPDTLIINW